MRAAHRSLFMLHEPMMDCLTDVALRPDHGRSVPLIHYLPLAAFASSLHPQTTINRTSAPLPLPDCFTAKSRITRIPPGP